MQALQRRAEHTRVGLFSAHLFGDGPCVEHIPQTEPAEDVLKRDDAPVGDERERVIENYRILGAALGLDVMRAAYTKQVHGTHVRLVTDADRCGPTDPAPCDADGLVTSVKGLPIFCFTADCVPLLLHDPAGGTAGAVHCGWRSSVSDIPGVAVGLMRSLGSRPGDIRAAIGPAIGYCCFETDADVPEAVERWLGGDTEGLIRRKDLPGKYLVDPRGWTPSRTP